MKHAHLHAMDTASMQHTATHCNTPQRAQTHCNTLQHTATRCNTPQHTAKNCKRSSSHMQWKRQVCNSLQLTAKLCNTLQRAATDHPRPMELARKSPTSCIPHASIMSITATHCNTLHHTATHYVLYSACLNHVYRLVFRMSIDLESFTP